jgi:hypothetical protein
MYPYCGKKSPIDNQSTGPDQLSSNTQKDTKTEQQLSRMAVPGSRPYHLQLSSVLAFLGGLIEGGGGGARP